MLRDANAALAATPNYNPLIRRFRDTHKVAQVDCIKTVRVRRMAAFAEASQEHRLSRFFQLHNRATLDNLDPPAVNEDLEHRPWQREVAVNARRVALNASLFFVPRRSVTRFGHPQART